MSPEFNYFNYEPILEWANATVEYNDQFIDGEGTISTIEEFGGYSLIWKHGVIHLGYNKEEREKARMSAALFIYLWTRGVDCSIAESCSILYSNNVTMKKLTENK